MTRYSGLLACFRTGDGYCCVGKKNRVIISARLWLIKHSCGDYDWKNMCEAITQNSGGDIKYIIYTLSPKTVEESSIYIH